MILLNTEHIEITSLGGSPIFDREPKYLFVGFEIEGFSKSMRVEGESFDKILAIVKEAIKQKLSFNSEG